MDFNELELEEVRTDLLYLRGMIYSLRTANWAEDGQRKLEATSGAMLACERQVERVVALLDPIADGFKPKEDAA